MNGSRIVTVLAGMVLLFAGWIVPACAQRFIGLGIQYTETRFQWARGLGIDRVEPGQLAARLGLERWDFIYRLRLTRNGLTITDRRTQSGMDLDAVLSRARNGDIMTVTFSRDGGHWYMSSAPVGYGYSVGPGDGKPTEIGKPDDPELTK